MKIVFAALLLAVVVLAWLLNVEMTANREQRDQIQKLAASLADKTKRDGLELQEKCATQADKMYSKELGKWKIPVELSFNSHYNAKLNKCFMDYTARGKYFIKRYLVDAYEQRGYAESHSMTNETEEVVVGCSLMPLGAAVSDCNSVNEYKAFVAKYME